MQTERQMIPIKRALISVSDKTNIIEFARQLSDFDIEIISTGGTAQILRQSGIPVIDVSEYTGFPEMMDGRVKTLHPRIHGGLLGRRGVDDRELEKNGIGYIDLVAVNLYPFVKTIADPDCKLATAIENIDIGGPTMIRAAAKNYHNVCVVVDHNDYDTVIQELRADSCIVSDDMRFSLALKAFEHTAQYDDAIANYLGGIQHDRKERAYFPHTYNSQFIKQQDLRYGENPHQRAAFYMDIQQNEASVSTAQQLQGKELSFNNIADAETALECVREFSEQPACVIVKHANPCGVAIGDTLVSAYERAFSTDPTSAFGGIIAFNRTLDAQTAKAILDRQFVEVIIAPAIDENVISITSGKPNVRILTSGQWPETRRQDFDYKRVTGGLLIQDRDNGMINRSELKVVTERAPSAQELDDLLFSWKVAKYVKSNAIVYARNGMTIGIGAGQMSRVYSARIAAIKAADAKLEVRDSVMASDAFFPFRDGLDSAAQSGITAVIQPGGSMRDEEVIAAANEHNIAMVFTGMRHFRH